MSPILGSFGAIAARAFQSIGGAFSAFSDNFNRTTVGLLGTSSSGGLWLALKGTWFANSYSAQSDDAASTYPIANIEMTKPDTTSSISTGGDVVISSTGTVQSVAAGGTAGFYTAQIINLTTTTGFAVGQWISATNGTGSLYGGAPDYVEITSIDSSTSLSYRIKGGTTPTAGTVTNVTTRNNDGGSGVALWITDSGNWWGVSYGRSIDTSCNCSTCNTCAFWSTSSGWICGSGYQTYTAPNTCNSWSSYVGANCSSSTGPNCVVYSGSFCVVWAYNCIAWTSATFYSCNSYTPGGSYTNCPWLYSYSTNFCSGGYYYYSCNCQTCYPPYIRIFQSASNAVSEITRWTLASMAAAFKVITNSTTKVITIRPYRDKAMTTQIGADLTYTASSATMANKFGIVLSPSDQIQGKQLDDYNITSN